MRFNVIMRHFSSHGQNLLGRWSRLQKKYQIDRRIYYANTDNCGYTHPHHVVGNGVVVGHKGASLPDIFRRDLSILDKNVTEKNSSMNKIDI